MKKIILILLSLIPFLLFAQKTKKITDKKTDEKYSVLKSDKLTKHGEYRKFTHKNELLIKGYYKNGIKDSVWQFYNRSGELEQKYDYTSKKLTYSKAGEADSMINRLPIFLGGESRLIDFISDNLVYPPMAIENNVSGKVVISFTVFKDGKAGNFQIKKSAGTGFGLDEAALRVVKLMSDQWIPGLENGHPVDKDFSFPVSFRLR